MASKILVEMMYISTTADGDVVFKELKAYKDGDECSTNVFIDGEIHINKDILSKDFTGQITVTIQED